MGETKIENSIKYLTAMRKTFQADSEHLSVAINTMRKYQKIKEILNDDGYYEDYGNKAESFIVSAISEVIEDGKID